MTLTQHRPHELLGEYREAARKYRRAAESDDGYAKADASARMTTTADRLREHGYRVAAEEPRPPAVRYRLRRLDNA